MKARHPRHLRLDATHVIVSALLAAVEAHPEGVKVPGLGVFRVAVRKSRKGRDPRTGASIMLPESRELRFRATADVRQRLNRREE